MTGERNCLHGLMHYGGKMNIELTDDEKNLIVQMRKWHNGIPSDSVSSKGKNGNMLIYIKLLAARAELYKMSLQNNYNDTVRLREKMLDLISPSLLIELCKSWEDLRNIDNNSYGS